MLVLKAIFIALLLLCGYLMLPLLLAVIAPLFGLTVLVGLIWFILKVIQEDEQDEKQD
ncbi:MAG: hypothetical protein ACT4OK_10935 [Gemmobacter sp.]